MLCGQTGGSLSVFIYYVMHVCTYLNQMYYKNQLIESNY